MKKERKAKAYLYSHYPEFTKYPMTAEWSALWFEDHEVFYAEVEDQREVVLNPGEEKEFYTINTPNGQETIKRKVYDKDLPQNERGKIIAYSAVPRFRSKIHAGKYKGQNFNDIKDSLTPQEMSKEGLLIPQKVGTYYELFQSTNGSIYWVNPKDYYEDSEQNKRITKKIFNRASKNSGKSKKNKRNSRR